MSCTDPITRRTDYARWMAAALMVMLCLCSLWMMFQSSYQLLMASPEDRTARDITWIVYSISVLLLSLGILRLVCQGGSAETRSRQPLRPKNLFFDVALSFLFASLIVGLGGTLDQLLYAVENAALWQQLMRSDSIASLITAAAIPTPIVLAISYWLIYREWRKKPVKRDYRGLLFPLIAINFAFSFIIRMNLSWPVIVTNNPLNDGFAVNKLVQAEDVATGIILSTAGLTCIGLLFLSLRSIKDQMRGQPPLFRKRPFPGSESGS